MACFFLKKKLLPDEITNVDKKLFTCLGEIPQNSTLCFGSEDLLTFDKTRVAVDDCNGFKCEYKCYNNFEVIENSCQKISVTYSCSGHVPLNSNLCTGDDRNLISSSNQSGIAVDNCSNTKCEYKCNDGYQVNGNNCEKIIDSNFFKKIEIEDFEFKSDGKGKAISDGWILWSNGYVKETVNFSISANYEFIISARGDTAGGVAPSMRITVDGQSIEDIFVTTTSWSNYSVIRINLSSGSHVVKIYFTNDYNQNGEDRNLYLDKLIINKYDINTQYYCTGITPSNSDPCGNYDVGPMKNDLSKKAVDSCTDRQCEYLCNSGYYADGNSCEKRTVETDTSIRPYQDNKFYWSYKNQPVLLLGGSDDDNLFQWSEDDLVSHLNKLKNAGGNIIRNTMSDRKDKGFEVYPFHQKSSGQYDLNHWNTIYWNRFERLLEETKKRDIIVQIEIWDRFDYTDYQSFKNWAGHPYNPKNNINYTADESGLRTLYDTHHPGNPNGDYRFFTTVPDLDNNTKVLKFQEMFVDKMLSYTLKYRHILYCIDNETDANEKWSKYWANYIKAKAERPIYVTEMWDTRNIKDPIHARTYNHPETYDFVDVSQNNHNDGDEHWNNFLYIRNKLLNNPIPINITKTYGGSLANYGTEKDGLDRFWRHLIAGAAMNRFHRPSGGIGLNDKAANSIKAARLVLMMES